ncbi:YbjQ family protein [Candidatus Omnitrophota bacterium]
MIVTNIDSVPEKKIIEHFGVVQGSTVRARHAGADIAAGLKNLVGGELRGYTKLLEEARAEALERMNKQAEMMGANAVINVRFATAAITQGAAELMAYGTAVKVA